MVLKLKSKKLQHSGILYKNERGIALVTALLFLMALTVLGGTAIVISSTDIQIGGNYKLSKQAFYIAEAGISNGISVLNSGISNGFNDELSNGTLLSSISFADGTYNVTVTDNNDDSNQSTDSDKTIVLSSIAQKNGAAKEIKVVVTYEYNPTNAITTNGDLRINGNPTIAGSGGSVHSNSDLQVVGSPNIAQDATSSGTTTVTGSPTIGGSTLSGTSNEIIPPINPTDFAPYADYRLTSDGKVYDTHGVFVADANSTSWNGWKYKSSQSKWSQNSNSTIDGTFYIVGDVQISGSPGDATTPWQVTIIATGDIDIAGSPNIATNPSNPSETKNLLFVAGGDIEISGTTSQVWQGIIAAHEQIDVSGNVQLNGCMIAEDAATDSNLVKNNQIHGNMTLTYTGLSTPFNSDKVQILSWREVNE